jgi:hypothetical protein
MMNVRTSRKKKGKRRGMKEKARRYIRCKGSKTLVPIV